MEETEIERLLGRAPRISLQEILRHPRLPEARKAYLDRFLAVYDGDPFLVRLLIEMGRFLLAYLVLVLEAAEDPARRETWLTVGRLKQAMAETGTASDRHIDALVARLCSVGYLESRRSEQDGRVRLLRSSEKLRAHDRAWTIANYAHLAVLYPQHDYALALQCGPQFQSRLRFASLPFAPLGSWLIQSTPNIRLFFAHAGAPVIFAALLQTAMEAQDQHAALRYAEIGDRFGISRTHIRLLLVAAEEAGLVKLHERGGRRVEILPRLWSDHDYGMAGGMYFHDVVYLAATRDLIGEVKDEAGIESAAAPEKMRRAHNTNAASALKN